MVMATTETSGLIRHLQTVGEMSDAALVRALGITPKKLEAYKSGEQSGTRAVNMALGILAEHVGFEEGGLSKDVAAKIKPGQYVEYNGERCQVLSVKVRGGSNPPYFSLIGQDIYAGVSYRFVQIDRQSPQPATVEPDNGRQRKAA